LRPGAAAWSSVLLLLLSPAPPASPAPAEGQPAAAEEDRPLDARTYAQGLDQLRQGKRDEAIQALRKVFQDFPDSPYAPQALLKTADLIYPASAWDQIGSASPAAIKDAGDMLAALSQKYRSSREAPRALVKLGYLSLEPAPTATGPTTPTSVRACARPCARIPPSPPTSSPA